MSLFEQLTSDISDSGRVAVVKSRIEIIRRDKQLLYERLYDLETEENKLIKELSNELLQNKKK